MNHPIVDLRHGDCLDVLRQIPDESIHAVVTDPPYGLANTDSAHVVETLSKWFAGERNYLHSGKGFMGKAWDAFVPPPAVWDECFRVLKPGGHLLAFSGARTADLMGLSIRLAGFDIRDSIAWLTSNGFPKSGDLGKRASGWDGWSSQLKPANEPCLVARKPLHVGVTITENVLSNGTGALNIAATRIAYAVDDATLEWGKKYGGKLKADGQQYAQGLGASGLMGIGKMQGSVNLNGRWPTNVVANEGIAEEMGPGVSKFFPVFKYQAKASARERQGVNSITHPTVKPLELMRWLVRLVTPPGGTVLEPFAGSGTTVEAALLEGFNVIGIEREADYLPLIQQRIDRFEQMAKNNVSENLGLW